MSEETIKKIQQLDEVATALSQARIRAEMARKEVNKLVEQQQQLLREIREDPEARALFGLRAPGKRAKKEG